jgi:transposase InsO family protein
MVSMTLADWAEQHNVMLEFIKPGRPMQNGFIERFNRSYREAVLDMLSFKACQKCVNRPPSRLRSTTKNDTQVFGPSDAQGIFVIQEPEISSNSCM